MIRVLVVDDEAPARHKLVTLLAGHSDVEVLDPASDGAEAVDKIVELRPDLVLLDIQMPHLDGFAVVEAIGIERMPTVVFVTAYDEHALRAFEVHALDYLLKPVSAERLDGVLDRVRRTIEAGGAVAAAHRVEQMLADLVHERRPLRRLLVASGRDRQVLLDLDDVTVLRADRNTVRFITADGEFRRRMTLSELERRLDPEAFLRLNRSEIVRLAAIREVQPWFHGDARVVLHDGTVLSWSRRFRARAAHLL
jgi:two-component system LytT family response regulator